MAVKKHKNVLKTKEHCSQKTCFLHR